MNEMTAYESALGCKEGSDGATKETEETTNKRNDEVVSGDWVANEGRGNGGLDGWGCLMVSCTLASHANLTTSYKPVSVHSWCRVKCEVSSRQQTVRGEGYERGEGGLPYGKRGRSAVASVALVYRRLPRARTILHCFKTWQRRHNSEIK